LTVGEIRRKEERELALKKAQDEMDRRAKKKLNYKTPSKKIQKFKNKKSKNNKLQNKEYTPIPTTQSSESRRQLLLESRQQIMNHSTEFANIERHSPGVWSKIKTIPISQGVQGVLPPLLGIHDDGIRNTRNSPTKRQVAKVKGPKVDTLKISMVGDMFDMLYRPRSVGSVATPDINAISVTEMSLQENIDSSTLILLRSHTADSTTSNVREQSREQCRNQALKLLMYPLPVPIFNGTRPIQEKRMDKVSNAYLSLSNTSKSKLKSPKLKMKKLMHPSPLNSQLNLETMVKVVKSLIHLLCFINIQEQVVKIEIIWVRLNRKY
jgi:hypothetical protein